MRRSLLDINVLLALLDSDHVSHIRATEWLDDQIGAGWASCAITENGFVRIVSQPRYPSPISVSEAIDLLAGATHSFHHEFWRCDISLLDPRNVRGSLMHGARQVTDVYLLALATANDGRFVTLDRSISVAAVPGASEDHLTVI